MKYNKIYVIAPEKTTTGGVELAHQLVDCLRQNGQEAYIVYSDWNKISSNQRITEAYRCYNIESTNIIEDTPDNLLVLPEIYFDYIFQFTNIQIGCWWMSVDNRYYRVKWYEKIYRLKGLRGKIVYIRDLLFRDVHLYHNTTSLLKKESSRIIHFYQSRYAQNHLYNEGFYKVLPLSDYININFFDNITKDKMDIVLYNPAKGLRFTNKIIKKMPDVKFVPLKGLSREEMKTLLGKAKLYIDFGEFPGKDRIPREAAICGCCLVTGKLGAAGFYEDLPIKESYKFELKRKNVNDIIQKIYYVLNNYSSCIVDFDDYRRSIIREKEVFYEEIKKAFT